MSRQSFEFIAFGASYRSKSFSALQGLEIMDRQDEIHPCDMLSDTEVQDENGEWKSLGDRNVVNEHVRDCIGIVPPVFVLRGVMGVVYDMNFRFLEKWKGVKIPSRFVDGSATASSKHISPMIAQIISDGAATMRELEEYYSLHDAFKMFDIIMAKGLNEALSSEAANSKSRRK